MVHTTGVLESETHSFVSMLIDVKSKFLFYGSTTEFVTWHDRVSSCTTWESHSSLFLSSPPDFKLLTEVETSFPS